MAAFLDDFGATLAAAVADLPPGAAVVELGGGANPLLGGHPRIAGRELRYLVVDSAADEVAKARGPVEAVTGDVTDPNLAASPGVARRHQDDGRTRTVRRRAVAQRPPVAGARGPLPPALTGALRPPVPRQPAAPREAAGAALDRIAPRDRGRHGKFPAYYDLCRGPSQRHLARYRDLGFDVVAARGYFGHGYYKRFPTTGPDRGGQVQIARPPARGSPLQLCGRSAGATRRRGPGGGGST
ncbi:MAG: hypothetical protein ACRD2W_23210 [Acidimicrobiales bacterium]